jgi:hypothetical protein
MATDHEILGRASVDDLEAILAVSNQDVDEAIHAVQDNADSIFTWDYEKGARPALNKLYEKAKNAQWNGETDLDWSIEVDPSQVLVGLQGSNAGGPFAAVADMEGSPFKHFGDKEWNELAVESLNWRMSQFMHGEQGALICTAKIVETVPWIDAKYYASTQVMDEARHVEVFAKYLDTKLSGHYPINAHLKMLLDDIVSDSRWDMTYLGMQIMVEGLALAAFGFQYQTSPDPLLKQITRYVMADEARHVAFGVMSLKEAYQDLDAADIRERQEFCYEAAVKMRDRFLGQEVWEWAGLPVKECTRVMLDAPMQREFRKMLFSKIVPNLKKLGLLDAGDGWLRQKFGELGVLEYEDWEDTGAEYERMQLEQTAG